MNINKPMVGDEEIYVCGAVDGDDEKAVGPVE